jgi:N6-L-threonylcarbamoyladenine synthase
MVPVVEKALSDAGASWDDIDAIAVTYAPGLIGSLLIGTLAARTLAMMKKKPLYPIHHVEGHVYANFLSSPSSVKPLATSSTETSAARVSGGANALPEARREAVEGEDGSEKATPAFPLLALIVSGGHSQLVLFRGHGNYELLGQTQDDAVGEAFDKVAKIIGLPYPGGPSVAKAAEHGNPKAFPLPKARMQNPYDFSFSGLKTAVLRTVQAQVGKKYDFPSHQLPELVSDSLRADVAASFQRIAVETLVDKTERAYRDFAPASVVIAGGVAANQELRRQLSERLPLHIEYAPMNLCTDNAAMIASLGYFYAQKNKPTDPRDLEVVPSLSMTKTAWAK